MSRLLLAQAGISAALGVGYNRRNVPWLLLTVAIALAVCGLAVAVRSGRPGAWLTAISLESTLVAVGLFRFAYTTYLGGTLLAIITLGTLLHPAVFRAFAPVSTASPAGAGEGVGAGAAAELRGSRVSP